MYDHNTIEKKWQNIWKTTTQKTTIHNQQPKTYILDMFPYPSGEGLHIGHIRVYTASDITARYSRMQGKNVLHPMGWDAFGLPAENYAIKHKTHPAVTTKNNIESIKRQFIALGTSYDWEREINTTDPGYYKWTQWIFLKLFERGLAYQAEVPINWCPSCKTGLANEEVIAGKCERCGTETIRKNMKQWMLRITEYADRLLADLDDLNWPDKIKLMQTNWIGRSEGASVKFKIDGAENEIEVFTTRPDTLFGATYMVLSPEHPLVTSIVTKERKLEVEKYIKASQTKNDLERTELQKEKTGVFTGSYAINPINDNDIPIWIADYVLMSYGTGAIMAVPAHDQRDFEFAKKYNLPIKQVIRANKSNWTNISNKSNSNCDNEAYTGDGVLANSSEYTGLDSKTAKIKIIEKLKLIGAGDAAVNYKLRDWIFSRQRYWGEPIPVIHCPKCGVVQISEKDLPVLLPNLEKYEPIGTGESPLAEVSEWVNTKCLKCGGDAKRETNTMPQWAGSCWYYLRYIDPHNKNSLASNYLLKMWLPVDIYMGGAEHAVLHLLYARFWHKFLFDISVVTSPEPFARLESVGIVLAKSYKDKDSKYVQVTDVLVEGDKAYQKSTGQLLTSEIEKMSKSKGNVVSPDDIIAKYGADALRVYIMFLGPWGEMCSFDMNGMEGASRFLKRAYYLIDRFIVRGAETLQVDLKAGDDKNVKKLIAQSTIKVTADIEKFRFNTAISQLMIMLNGLEKSESITKYDLEIFLQLISPFAPHIAEEMWQKLGHNSSIFVSVWPLADTKDIIEDLIDIAVQINGKVRGAVRCAPGYGKDEVLALLRKDTKISAHIKGKITKKIYIKDKLISLIDG